jgi:hypothetical protein
MLTIPPSNTHHTLTATFLKHNVSDPKNEIAACQQTDLVFERAMKHTELKTTVFRQHGKCFYKNAIGLHF